MIKRVALISLLANTCCLEQGLPSSLFQANCCLQQHVVGNRIAELNAKKNTFTAFLLDNGSSLPCLPPCAWRRESPLLLSHCCRQWWGCWWWWWQTREKSSFAVPQTWSPASPPPCAPPCCSADPQTSRHRHPPRLSDGTQASQVLFNKTNKHFFSFL